MALSEVEGLTGGSSVFKDFLDSPPEFIPDQIRDQNDGKRNNSKVSHPGVVLGLVCPVSDPGFDMKNQFFSCNKFWN